MGFFCVLYAAFSHLFFSHPHHLGLIAAFTIMVSSPNLTSDTDCPLPEEQFGFISNAIL